MRLVKTHADWEIQFSKHMHHLLLPPLMMTIEMQMLTSASAAEIRSSMVTAVRRFETFTAPRA